MERYLQDAFGLRGLGDAAWFSRFQIHLAAAEELLPELEPYYLPCKAEEFLLTAPFTYARAITIGRHLVRAHGYDLRARERTNQGKKDLWYTIVSAGAATPQVESFTVSFE